MHTVTPSWDIGRPQPAFTELAEAGLWRGRLLDIRCGTAEHVLLASSSPRIAGSSSHLSADTLARMGDIRIYHNPACKHSRGALEILEQRAPDAEVVLYLETPPSSAELERLIELLEEPPADLVRKDQRFAELGLVESDYQTPEQVVAVLVKHPELMQRPIIVKNDRAVLARPSEKVLTLLEG